MPSGMRNPDLGARTLQLVDIPSESRNEAALVSLVRDLVPLEPLYDDGDCLLYGEPGAPVLLAGHLDTVPAQDNIPGRLENGAVHGLGASDMKGGIAVMLELVRDPELARRARYVFFTREEIGVDVSPLPALFASGLLTDASLAVVLEPTDNELHAGCLGNVVARATFHGVSTHSARPWTGVNAIHEAIKTLGPLAELEPLDVEIEGLVFREVVSIVKIDGGIAENVVPDRASCVLNYRFAPGRSNVEAEERLQQLVPAAHLEVLHTSLAAPVALSHPLVERLRQLVPTVKPKQAWTPVAQFAEAGIQAINYGPGSPAFAHKREEQVSIENLDRSFETLRAFLLDTV
jgi:succinyl-diaminopimelate desuccinylase